MPVSPETIREKLEARIPIQHLDIVDQSSGCGANYSLVIVSEAFQGKSTLARHRMVNEMLKDEIAQLHAFSQKSLTPAQFAQSGDGK